MIDIKICGIKDYKAALIAQNNGATHIGFVFHKPSKRYIDPKAAARIIKNLRSVSNGYIKYVGLFVNKSIENITYTADLCNLDIIQLCGEEKPSFCDALALPVFKVIHVQPTHKLEDIEQMIDIYLNHVNKIILDKGMVGLRGGTGETFDWNIAEQLSSKGHDFMLAGGLNITNIRQAIRTINPSAVDISSGVETDGMW